MYCTSDITLFTPQQQQFVLVIGDLKVLYHGSFNSENPLGKIIKTFQGLIGLITCFW